MGSLVFLLISLSFGQKYFNSIHEQLVNLEKEFENPQQFAEKHKRIAQLSEMDCARELSQMTGTHMGVNEDCHTRLWKATFRYLHYSQMEKISEELDHKMSSLPVQDMDQKKKVKVLKEVKELKDLWKKVFGDRKA
ncbi:MAG: hypothetical protein COW00_09765 [Bdellovibrio sp. CG12_big_fil_rev_8_21_14_0_65_39_13]|nr:MAG: hypothetical protein COW78_15930 [Bdellovibrio sp. CG22_combo_CG10-13_8_21_14_all_39_27]PIQ59586.1 MAG: hypothetical protein COW00_09765 [Bdellovibrio sp. CG12_big_fil_rev_8_21_14_0_65_39_13]PIR33178.1 MAG: hypothetical protein COV37_17180 [Bdellovibrio sp. CG11_big_fil_rev_8_21_14_0_20_39_38]